MTASLPITLKRLTPLVRIALGGVFLYSCFEKILDPQAFAAIVANYQLLPPWGVWITALVFPWLEALCGVALVLGRLEKGAAALVCAMMAFFIATLFYNHYRGLNIACGCFSLAADKPADLTVNTLRNLAILAAGAWVLCLGRHRATLAATSRPIHRQET